MPAVSCETYSTEIGLSCYYRDSIFALMKIKEMYNFSPSTDGKQLEMGS